MAGAVPEHGLRARGRRQARRRRRRQRVDRRHARARRVAVPGRRASSTRENHGFAHANNRGADDVHRALRALPQPRHRDRRRDLRRAGRGARRAARRRPGRGASSSPATARCGRRSATSRASRRALGRGPRLRALAACAARWAGERELDLALYEREVECDWTSGSFMLCRREALLSAGLLDERFFIYSEEPDLCLRMKRAGWAHPAPADDDDRPPRRQGRAAPEDGRPGRLHAPPVRAQALRRTPSRGLPGRGRRPPRGARHRPRGRGRAAAPGRRAARPAHARRAARRRRSARRRRRRSAARARASGPSAGTPPNHPFGRPASAWTFRGTKRSGTSWRTFGGAFAPRGVGQTTWAGFPV